MQDLLLLENSRIDWQHSDSPRLHREATKHAENRIDPRLDKAHWHKSCLQVLVKHAHV